MVSTVSIVGLVTLALKDLEGADAGFLASQLDPYRLVAGGDGQPDVIIERVPPISGEHVDLQGDAGDGRLTVSDGRTFFLLHGGRRCTIPLPGATGPARFACERGFPLWQVLAAARQALMLALPERGAVAVHGASVALGEGVVIAGWSESGKTETALALVECGARFVSDKWTVLTPKGELAAFPIGVGVRGWVLRYLPVLRAQMPRRARAQLRAAGIARNASGLAAAMRIDGPVGSRLVEAAQRGAALGDRVALSPTAIRAAHGQARDTGWTAPLRTLVLLTTTPAGSPPRVRPADRRWAAARLARSAAFERRLLFGLFERAGYAFPDRLLEKADAFSSREQTLLEGLLAPVRVLEIAVPFPTDPRPVAEAIATAIST